MMDDRGYLSTLDAAVALVIVILMSAVLLSFNGTQSLGARCTADDLLDVMAVYPSENESMLKGIVLYGDINSPSAFLNSTIPGMKYNLTMDPGTGEKTVTANGDMSAAADIDTAVRNYGNVTFRLHLWNY